MKVTAISIALLCLVHMSVAMSVEFMDDQCGNQSNTGIRLRVDNVGGSAIQNVELRYYFHKKQGKTPQLDVYYAPGVSASIREADSESAYVEILAESIPSGYFPNQGGMSFGLHYSDWSAWDKSLDPSYQNSSTLQRNDKIALLVNGVAEQSQAENEEPMMKPVLPEDGYTLNAAEQASAFLSESEILKSISFYQSPKKDGNNVFLELEIPEGKKDSKMLDFVDRENDILGFSPLTYINLYHWGDIHIEGAARCPMISLQILNHYYGGTITQDELYFHSKYDKARPFMSLFPHSASSFSEDDVMWALNARDVLVYRGDTRFAGTQIFSFAVFKKAIDNGIVCAVFIRAPGTSSTSFGVGHFVVVHGYNEVEKKLFVANVKNTSEKDDRDVYLGYGEENGKSSYIVYPNGTKYTIETVYIPIVDRGTLARTTDRRLWMDSDGDGITNFDEEERFCFLYDDDRHCFNPYAADSDNDGLDDLHEIQMMVRNSGKTILDLEDNAGKNVDVDYDGLFAGVDEDSDGDGIIDGMEDLNGDGFVDYDFETDPLDETIDFELDAAIDDVPDDYALYAFSELKINDRARCYNGIDTLKKDSEKFCNVASWARYVGFSQNSAFTYQFENGYSDGTTSTFIGVEAAIGNLDTWGMALLRNRCHLYGNLSVYAAKNENGKMVTLKTLRDRHFIDYQDGFIVDGQIISYDHSQWKRHLFSLSEMQKGSKSVTVKSGSTFVLGDGDAYSELIVENGATLKIHSGEMFVEKNLQLEPGAKVVFDNLDGCTVLHVAGDVMWKTTANTPTTDMAYWSQVASRFKLVSHTSKPIYIEGQWGGTIYNPLGKIVIGQAEKLIYGRFLAKKIEQHQYSKLFRVDFVKNPNPPLAVGLK